MVWAFCYRNSLDYLAFHCLASQLFSLLYNHFPAYSLCFKQTLSRVSLFLIILFWYIDIFPICHNWLGNWDESRHIDGAQAQRPHKQRFLQENIRNCIIFVLHLLTSYWSILLSNLHSFDFFTVYGSSIFQLDLWMTSRQEMPLSPAPSAVLITVSYYWIPHTANASCSHL